jgi:hypothetical protein
MDDTMNAYDLHTENRALNQRVAELECTVAELSALVNHFQELFKLSQHRRFGASSEKTLQVAGQITLFGEPSKAAPVSAALEGKITAKGRKQKGKRQDDLSKLPLTVIEYDLPDSERKRPGAAIYWKKSG